MAIFEDKLRWAWLGGLKSPESKDFQGLGKNLIHLDMLSYFSTKYQSFFCTLCKKKTKKKKHICKNLVLELWSKNLKTNQNTGFFKSQYLRKNLRYEVEFLDMIRGPRKH